MGTVAQKLQAILDSKSDIKSAIEEKNVNVGQAPLAEYGDIIRENLHGKPLTTSERYCVGRWPSWHEYNSDAVSVDGSRELALDWYPVLVDMSPVEGEVRKRPVGWLKRNNFLRFEDGSFAPTVGITEAQRAECDVALYLDSQQNQQYCEAGEFDAEAFYNMYGMSQKLYDADGNEVRILRPWETTETKYSIFITRKDTVHLIDGLENEDGNMLYGIIADGKKVDGFSGLPLVPTGIAAGPCTQIDGKMRCFFFCYPTNEVGCMGLPPFGNITYEGEVFYQDGTYPRVLDNLLEGANGAYAKDDDKGVNQPKNAKYARACNFDPEAPFPVAEGGWHAWNVFTACLSAAYGTHNFVSAGRFSSGISSNDNGNNEANWRNFGGVRYRVQGAAAWTYAMFSANPVIYYNASGQRTDLSNTLNRYAPKALCMEAQMALSMAAELNIEPGVEFEFYGNKYHYASPSGAVPLLDGRMNARLYRVRKMTLHAWNASKVATTFDVEVNLRHAVAEGMNICGDIWSYMGGGHELVSVQEGSCYYFRNYIEPDQTKWADIDHTVTKAAGFEFEENYSYLGRGFMYGSGYTARRLPFSCWKIAEALSLALGEAGYQYQGNLSAGTRAGVRVRGHAAIAYCSPRAVSSSAAVSACIAYSAGSAQVLLEV